MLVAGAAADLWDLDTLAGVMALAREIDRQAAMIAYVNDFWLMTLLAFGSIPRRRAREARLEAMHDPA